jgi:hypothetical protein
MTDDGVLAIKNVSGVMSLFDNGICTTLDDHDVGLAFDGK